MDINLDEHFRQGAHSKARQVAELLLSGRPYTRQQLSEEVGGVAVTTVNRVVEILDEAGATIVREADGRQAVFQVVAQEARAKKSTPGLGAKGKIVRDEYIGGMHVVDVTTGSQRFRGNYPGLTSLPPVATNIVIAGIEKTNDELIVLIEPEKGKRFRLEYVQNIRD